jgi:hypothetical protein
MAGTSNTFGSCCDSLKEELAGGEGGEDGTFEPLIASAEDGVLYMSVGLVSMEDDEPGMIDHPIFFCPFCGSKLQTPEDVDAKTGASS